MDWNPSGLAIQLGLSHVAVSDWLHGHTEPKDENIVKLAHVLHVPVEDVYSALGRIPPQAQYGLTESGRRLLAVLREMPPDLQDVVAVGAEALAKRMLEQRQEDTPDTPQAASE